MRTVGERGNNIEIWRWLAGRMLYPLICERHARPSSNCGSRGGFSFHSRYVLIHFWYELNRFRYEPTEIEIEVGQKAILLFVNWAREVFKVFKFFVLIREGMWYLFVIDRLELLNSLHWDWFVWARDACSVFSVSNCCIWASICIGEWILFILCDARGGII